jgi:ubiquinone/menaquinone biosynthesis C-methylase UbiE
MSMNSKEFYANVDFDIWAEKEKLNRDEKYIIKTYLDQDKKIIEAGTAGGRILLEMKKLGFKFLYGYDFVPSFIEVAKKKDPSGSICFEVENAINLSYEDCSFEQIIYLQQIICSIEEEENRLKATKEAYRILRNGGTALFSFLSFEARCRTPIHIAYLAYLRTFRFIFGKNLSIQQIPYLKHDGKPNLYSLLDRSPHVYSYTIEEARQLLKKAGFKIVAIGSSYQIGQEKMHTSVETLKNEPIEGMIYFVCEK